MLHARIQAVHLKHCEQLSRSCSMAMRDGSAVRAQKSLHGLGNGKKVMVLSFLESLLQVPHLQYFAGMIMLNISRVNVKVWKLYNLLMLLNFYEPVKVCYPWLIDSKYRCRKTGAQTFNGVGGRLAVYNFCQSLITIDFLINILSKRFANKSEICRFYLRKTRGPE